MKTFKELGILFQQQGREDAKNNLLIKTFYTRCEELKIKAKESFRAAYEIGWRSSKTETL